MKITLEQISEITGVRVSVLRFALEMERKLKLNDHKGGWEGCSNSSLLSRIGEEHLELIDAIDNKRSRRVVINECADVANFAMMISENY